MIFTPVAFGSGTAYTCLYDEGDEPRSPACKANTLPTELPRDGGSVFLHVEYYIVPGLGEVCHVLSCCKFCIYTHPVNSKFTKRQVCCHWFLKDAFILHLHTLKSFSQKEATVMCYSVNIPFA